MQIACPNCQKQLRVADSVAGKKVKCPSCATVFPAVEAVEEIAEGSPPPKKPRRPDDDADAERLPRRRPRDDEEDDDDRPRRSRRRDDDDLDDDIGRVKSDKKTARRAGESGALWFILAGAATILFLVVKLIADLMTPMPNLPRGNAGFDAGVQVGRYAGIIGCGVISAIGAVFHFLAASNLKSFGSKGLVVTAIVFGFIFGSLFGIFVVLNMLGLFVILRMLSGMIAALVIINIIVGVVACFFNLFAAIKGILVLGNPAVKYEFERR